MARKNRILEGALHFDMVLGLMIRDTGVRFDPGQSSFRSRIARNTVLL